MERLYIKAREAPGIVPLALPQRTGGDARGSWVRYQHMLCEGFGRQLYETYGQVGQDG